MLFSVCAYNFDNRKTDYDTNTKTATIKNSFGLGTTLATVKLDSPQINYVMPGKDRLVAEFTIKNNQDYTDYLNKVDLYNMNKGGASLTRTLNYKYKTIERYETHSINHKECTIIDIPNNISSCNDVSEESITPIIKWIPLDIKQNLPRGDITIGIFTDVNDNDYVEWIPTLYGTEINEWAAWKSGLTTGLVAYYNFSGTSFIGSDIYSGTYNFTTMEQAGYSPPSTIIGLIARGANFSQIPHKAFSRTEGSTAISNGIFNFTVGNKTINLWLNETAINSDSVNYIMYGSTGAIRWGRTNVSAICGSGNDSCFFYQICSGTERHINTSFYPAGNFWLMHTLTINDTNVTIYINGVQIYQCSKNSPSAVGPILGLGGATSVNTRDVIGIIDEMSVYNRVLSTAEITQLYNNGAGITFSNIGVAVDLNTPTNAAINKTHSMTFNATINPLASNVTNATIYVYASDNSVYYSEFKTLSGDQRNNTIFTTVLGNGSYKWNVYGCSYASDDNIHNCSYAPANFTLQVKDVIENSQTFTNSTYISNFETFKLNVSYDVDYYTSITASLFYNNTEYVYNSFLNNLPNSITFVRTATTPIVSIPTNISFYWTVTLSNSTSSISINSSTNKQLVLPLMIATCNSSVSKTLLNYTLRDEETQNRIDSTLYNGTIEVSLQLYSYVGNVLIYNFSTNYTRTNNATICISNLSTNSTFLLNAQARYYAGGYVTKFNYIDNLTYYNNTLQQDITLFDLVSTNSRDFLVTYKATNLLAVENAIIVLTRKYVNEGVYKTVEMTKTDNFGQGILHLDTVNGIIYSAYVLVGGQLQATFNTVTPFCEDIVTGNCRLNLFASQGDIAQTDYYFYDNIGYTTSFNVSTRTITINFNSLNGGVVTALLNVTKADNYGNITICSNSLTSSAGILTCVIPVSYGNVSVHSDFIVNNNLIVSNNYGITPNPTQIFGNNRLIYVLALYITLPLLLIPSSIGIMIGILLGLILAIVLVYIDAGWLTAGSIFGWIVIAAGIIIYKIQREGT